MKGRRFFSCEPLLDLNASIFTEIISAVAMKKNAA
jgi:hypothetical protein